MSKKISKKKTKDQPTEENEVWLTDESICPTGQYKGTKMKDIPAEYLLEIYFRHIDTCKILYYIQENIETLHIEVKNKKKYG